MTITKKNGAYFGTCQNDIHEELTRYAGLVGYDIHHFKDAICECGNNTFSLHIDDTECVAIRVCTSCEKDHIMLDGEEYLEDAEFYHAVCTCESSPFEITVGVNLYPAEDGSALSEDVRWLYIGCRCPKCNQIGCYADWKNEYSGYKKLLMKV